MIWIRRFLIMPLGLVFFVLFILTLLIFRISETFLEPQFYKSELAKADIYEFLLDELPRAAIEELRSKSPDFFSDTLNENPLTTISLTTDDIVSSFNRALPPSWVQEQVEQIIDQTGAYITGESDSFEITITAAERVKAATQEVEELIRKAKVYDFFFDEFVIPEIDKALAEDGTLPFKVALTSEDLVDAVQAVAPENWVKDQVEQALDEMTAYVVGDQEGFEVNVQMAERSDIALEEIKTLLKKASFVELLFGDVVDPMLEGSLDQMITLPFGVGITQEEVTAALRELVPPSWLEEQVLVVIDEAGPYLTGKTDTFQAVISLADRKEVALAIIEDLAKSKLDALMEGLPQCSFGQLPFGGIIPSQDELPVCIPQGIEIETLIDLLDIDVIGGVRDMVGGQIPDQLVYTQADLRNALVGDGDASNLETLDNIREIIAQGWTYTVVDLREDMGEGSLDILDNLRAALTDGFTYTDVDFREDLADSGDGAVLGNLDEFRSQLSRARDLRFLVYVFWALLLALIGILGGRRWWSKIAWAAATLAICAAIAFAASGPVWENIGQSEIDDLRAELIQDVDSPTQLLAAEKGLDVAEMVADDFLGGIKRSSLTLLIVSLAVWGGSFAWSKFARKPASTQDDVVAT